MLHFNGLQYYAVPSLPTAWKAPTWLKIELGIFAGRLYFDYEEYDDLCKYLGFQEAAVRLAESTDDSVAIDELDETGERLGNVINEREIVTRAQQLQSFTKQPLIFLREWLTLRRKGQDFGHTPMGYVCQGKPLTANHPFFSKSESGGLTNTEYTDMRDDSGLGRNVGGLNDDINPVFDEDGFR